MKNALRRQSCMNLFAAALTVALTVAWPLMAQATGQSVNVSLTEPSVNSYKPDSYINPTGYGSHYISMPNSGAPSILLVFLGGSGSAPSSYTNIVDEAANASSTYKTGYAAVGLAYINGSLTQTIGQTCGKAGDKTKGAPAPSMDDCFTQMRGESTFGAGVSYPGLLKTYDASVYTSVTNYPSTSLGDSVINRLVFLIDYMACKDIKQPSVWQSFLVDDPSGTSPYVTPHTANCSGLAYSRHVLPKWSQIVMAGHSQGGGTSGFMGMSLPGGVRRVAMFSAPQDNLGGNKSVPTANASLVASWISGATQTPLSAFYGLRNGSGSATPNNDAEGVYGNNVYNSWLYLGSATSGGGLGGEGYGGATSVADGSAIPANGAHKLYLTAPAYSSALSNHNSSAVNSAALDSERTIWDWIFSAGGIDSN